MTEMKHLAETTFLISPPPLSHSSAAALRSGLPQWLYPTHLWLHTWSGDKSQSDVRILHRWKCVKLKNKQLLTMESHYDEVFLTQVSCTNTWLMAHIIDQISSERSSCFFPNQFVAIGKSVDNRFSSRTSVHWVRMSLNNRKMSLVCVFIIYFQFSVVSVGTCWDL